MGGQSPSKIAEMNFKSWLLGQTKGKPQYETGNPTRGKKGSGSPTAISPSSSLPRVFSALPSLPRRCALLLRPPSYALGARLPPTRLSFLPPLSPLFLPPLPLPSSVLTCLLCSQVVASTELPEQGGRRRGCLVVVVVVVVDWAHASPIHPQPSPPRPIPPPSLYLCPIPDHHFALTPKARPDSLVAGMASTFGCEKGCALWCSVSPAVTTRTVLALLYLLDKLHGLSFLYSLSKFGPSLFRLPFAPPQLPSSHTATHTCALSIGVR